MKTEQLNEALGKLRAQIEMLDSRDEVSKQKLQSLILELERKLENPEDQQTHKDLAGRLDEALLHFEVSHPTLTAILNDVIIKLESMGI